MLEEVFLICKGKIGFTELSISLDLTHIGLMINMILLSIDMRLDKIISTFQIWSIKICLVEIGENRPRKKKRDTRLIFGEGRVKL
jgi:hypothetical protein